MGCGSCGTKKATNPTKYEVTFADGSKKTVNSEIEASAAVARRGGSYRPVRR